MGPTHHSLRARQVSGLSVMSVTSRSRTASCPTSRPCKRGRQIRGPRARVTRRIAMRGRSRSLPQPSISPIVPTSCRPDRGFCCRFAKSWVMTSFQDAIPNGGIQQRAHGAEKSIDLNQKRTTDGFKREYREMAAGRAISALYGIGFVMLSLDMRQLIMRKPLPEPVLRRPGKTRGPARRYPHQMVANFFYAGHVL